ncbi:MAG: type II secretion system protein [Planctomycetota bacterium]|jgi:prepilin-type N-terminal cleavage/methylation domain-containing protein
MISEYKIHGCRKGAPATTQKRRLGFTLIEVLVVVAIIALLLSILLPSLRQAREQAKVATCKANAKQIATMAATYKAEYKAYVPVMYTYASAIFAAGNSQAPARVAYLSLALRAYDKSTAHIKSRTNGLLDPEEHWAKPVNGKDRRTEYELRFLPDVYICPFDRGKGERQETVGDEGSFETIEFSGRREYYITWMREQSRFMRGAEITDTSDKVRGKVKYTATTWNRMNHAGKVVCPDGSTIPEISGMVHLKVPQTVANTQIVANSHRRWTAPDAHRLRCASYSDITVLYCAKGEHFEGNGKWANRKSHLSSTGGGTNAVFGDTHVEWVKGTQLRGW